MTTVRAVETELKYQVTDRTAIERLLGVDELAGFVAVAPVRTVEQVDRYLDTPDGALALGGYAARIREQDGTAVVGVKSLTTTPADGATHRREELEGPFEPDVPPRDWPESAARSVVLELAGDAPLEELVTLRQVRHKREYRRDDALVEVSLDEVAVVVGDRTVERFDELEAELFAGSEAALTAFSAAFDDLEGLEPAVGSKLERALDVVRGELPVADGPDVDDPPAGEAQDLAPRPSRHPGVRADDHLAEAGRKILRFHLALMVAREEGTRSGADAEDLHKMRVATRRQRAAWRVFGDAFDRRATTRHEKRLRAVARRLGAVRDLDVLIEGMEAYRASVPVDESQAIEPLVATWRRQRDVARDQLLRELDASRFRSWLDTYGAFAQTEGAGALPVGPVQPHRVRDTFPSRIWAAYEQVRAYESVLRWADVTTLHDLRIAGKWLRYTLEFVREALGRDVAPLIARVVALQDHLGLLNDADVAATLARTYLLEHAGDLSETESAAIGRYLVDREREVARLRRTLGPAWRGVVGVPFRKALGRVVAGL